MKIIKEVRIIILVVIMDYRQRKLTKHEWEAIEVPIHKDEKEILHLIYNGYENVDYKYNNSKSLLGFMKLSKDKKQINKFHIYLYISYFENIIKNIIKSYDLSIKIKVSKDKIGLKSADKIRINNTQEKIDELKKEIYEFILIDECKKYLKTSKTIHFYNLTQLMRNTIVSLNIYVEEFINKFIEIFEVNINREKLIEDSYKYIEKNKVLNKNTDKKLYNHQKELFTLCKEKRNKLILYEAPTGTGKTMSPIGLAKDNKVIFVCAAKHVGLQLARACVSMHIPIGIAFGCKDAGDVRLHYFAAKEYTKNYKSGGIFHVDHSIGDKVQVIISDVISYLPSMYYMSAFTENLNDIITYWDEPTISLDYEKHELHSIVSNIWKENNIPNMVLSSATLPKEHDIKNTLESFNNKFNNPLITSITSYECKKSIPIINLDGYYVLPHTIYQNYNELMKCINHCKDMKTVLRYMDLKSICKFITHINKKYELPEELTIKNYFKHFEKVDSVNIKVYYLELFEHLSESWDKIYNYFKEHNKQVHSSNVYVTTKDAHTLTYGPTLFLTNNVEKIAKFCYQSSNIPKTQLESIISNIEYNDKIKNSISKLNKQLSNKEDASKEDPTKTRIKKQPGDELRKKIETLQNHFKTIELDKKYIPNTHSHMYKEIGKTLENVFTSDVDSKIVEKIILLDEIDDLWKLLLIMGIGVFTNAHNNVTYLEIMKELAYKQKLYLIIASTDYIYGTNYQFCHEYLSKDLEDISQEKMIQALGRIGRSNNNQEYSIRLRSNKLIKTLFEKEENKIEVKNMNRLFST